MEKEKQKEIGRVNHWYDKIGVAVVKLSGAINKGDTIKIRHGGEEWEETVSSMQVDHAGVESAKKGDDLAIKLSKRAKEGATVYKVS